MRAMPSVIQSRYSKQQRAAVVAAFDRGIRPITRIPRMAEGGELALHGVPVEPFTVKYETALGWIRTEEKRRRKHATQLEPEDAIEGLRGRLIDAAALGIQRFEKQVRTGHADWELARQIARAMREIKGIPPKDKRAPAPGQRDPDTGEHNDGQTRSGLAGSIIKAARANAEDQTAPDLPSTQGTAENTGDGAATGRSNAQEESGHGTDEGRAVTRSRLLSAAP